MAERAARDAPQDAGTGTLGMLPCHLPSRSPTASPRSVMVMGDSGVLNRENLARLTEESPRRILGLVVLLMKCCTASSGMNTSRVPPSPLHGHFIRTAEVNSSGSSSPSAM